ncbi:AP2-containing protein [Hordeum vulgare]|nr:AP2-containing protein [Hordeum vulgare]
MYYMEIRSGDTRLGPGTFETSHMAARAYDAATRRLRRPCSHMNFLNVRTHEEAQARAPSPQLITAKGRRIQQRRERRLVAEADGKSMAVWR